VVEHINAEFDSVLTASSPKPTQPASKLATSSTLRAIPIGGKTLAFSARKKKNSPRYTAGVGALLDFGASNDPALSFLSESGFILDITGTHRVRALPKKSRLPEVFLSTRLHFATDQSFAVTDSTVDNDNEIPTSVDGFLTRADQIALGFQADFVFNESGRPIQWALFASYEIEYQSLPRRSLPGPLLVTDETGRTLAERTFTQAGIDAALDAASTPVPLTSFGSGFRLRFVRDSTSSFYAGAGYQAREVPFGTIRFRTTPTEDGGPSEESPAIEGTSDGSRRLFWRAVVGFQIPKLVDIRAETVAPFGQSSIRPILRIAVTKSFGKKS
ncbi:MAG: hypothetical protein AAF170_04375, partial [Bacteroidota bacterium]